MQSNPTEPRACPRYVSRGTPRAFRALFAGDEAFDIESSRVRAYPGLPGPAPDTRALYRIALAEVPGARRALDLGAGAGVGTAELSRALDEVVGLDIDPEAVRFARHYLPGTRFEVDGEGQAAPTDADLVCVVDVLGHAFAPEQVLRRARRALAENGRVFIAEPEAYPSQDLLPPTQLAFSKGTLGALLARAGLEVERWFDEVGQFVVCVARASADDHWQALERGEVASARGDHAEALRQYRHAAESSVPAVVLEASLGQAQAHVDLGELDAAATALLAAARVAPESARPLAGLSLMTLAAQDRPSALALAVRALENEPTEAWAAQALAESADSLRQEDALTAWRVAASLAPADVHVATELARASAARGNYAYAIKILERLREFRSDLGIDFHVTLAWLCLHAGRLSDARLEADVARAIDPDDEAVRELWAELERGAGA